MCSVFPQCHTPIHLPPNVHNHRRELRQVDFSNQLAHETLAFVHTIYPPPPLSKSASLAYHTDKKWAAEWGVGFHGAYMGPDVDPQDTYARLS